VTTIAQALAAASVTLPGVPESVREARAMVRRYLGADPTAEIAALAVSEMATNAIAYTRSGLPGGTFAVSLRTAADGVTIWVRDSGSRGVPALASPEPIAEHGRGLAIVAALSEAWGTEPAAAGRATWCRIAAVEADR
jgi:anti-sigma regulatory factor (Ser/Thr protein kinase)